MKLLHGIIIDFIGLTVGNIIILVTDKGYARFKDGHSKKRIIQSRSDQRGQTFDLKVFHDILTHYFKSQDYKHFLGIARHHYN